MKTKRIALRQLQQLDQIEAMLGDRRAEALTDRDRRAITRRLRRVKQLQAVWGQPNSRHIEDS